MRSLATLGGVLVLIVLAIAWRISNHNVEASNETDPRSGVVTLGVETSANGGDASLPGNGATGAGGSTADPAQDSNSNPGPGPAGGNNSGNSNLPTGDTPDPNAGQNESGGSAADGADPNQPADGDGAAGGNSDPTPPQPDPNSGQQEDESEESAPAGEIRYTVQTGDTLYGILMAAYGQAPPDLVEQIAVANDMDDPGAIRPGDEIKLPKLDGYPDPKNP